MSTGIGNATLAYARVWHLVDARGQVLGRLGSQIAQTLMGKHKPTYDPSADCGDYVVVVNAKHIAVTGRKASRRITGAIHGIPVASSLSAWKSSRRKTPRRSSRRPFQACAEEPAAQGTSRQADGVPRRRASLRRQHHQALRYKDPAGRPAHRI
ncbi:ribosomal protein L13 domain-containing protein, partial [Coemansia spiralis]